MSVTGAYPSVGLRTRGAEAPRDDALLHVCVSLTLVALTVSAFAVWTPFGIAATFLLTLIVANAMPAGVPVLIICAFLYQNLIVTWYTQVTIRFW